MQGGGWTAFHGGCISAEASQSFDILVCPAALLEEVRHQESSDIFPLLPPDQAATYDPHLTYCLGQIAVDPKEFLSGWLAHFYLAQDQAIMKLFTDHWEMVPNRSTLECAPVFDRGPVAGV